jgi:hypothetical protein
MRCFRSLVRALVASAALSVFGVGLLSCTPDFADQQALSRLIYNGIQTASGGAFATSDGVASEAFNLIADDVTVLLSNEAVSPKATSDLYDVLIDGYTVSYERTDGGSAVPSTIGTNFTERVRITAFGASPTLVSVNLRILNAEQKLLPPISDLNEFGFERSTNFLTIQTKATIHIFGKNLIGDRVDVSFPIRVTFCQACKVQ